MIERKIFIGCSSKVLKTGIVSALKELFSKDNRFSNFEIEVWNETMWENLQTAVFTLEKSLTRYDYAIFIGYPDDKITFNQQQWYTTRDNVTFEFGLFLSYLGSERTFFLKPDYTQHAHEFKILSDLGDSALTHLYKLKLDNNRFVFDKFIDPEKFLKQINTIEQTSLIHPSKEILNKKVGLLRQQILNLSEVNEKEGVEKFKRGIGQILQLKKNVVGIPLFDIIFDILDTINDIDDICKPKRIAELQSREKGVEEVWIFADDPIEFKPNNKFNTDIAILKSKVKENIKNGVKYTYFVSSKFERKNIKKHFSSKKEVLKNLHLIYIDAKFFKTYFTLHFKKENRNNQNLPEIYMSSLLEHRNDLFIQISDPEHKERIYERISKYKGEVNQDQGYTITNYVIKE